MHMYMYVGGVCSGYCLMLCSCVVSINVDLTAWLLCITLASQCLRLSGKEKLIHVHINRSWHYCCFHRSYSEKPVINSFDSFHNCKVSFSRASSLPLS